MKKSISLRSLQRTLSEPFYQLFMNAQYVLLREFNSSQSERMIVNREGKTFKTSLLENVNGQLYITITAYSNGNNMFSSQILNAGRKLGYSKSIYKDQVILGECIDTVAVESVCFILQTRIYCRKSDDRPMLKLIAVTFTVLDTNYSSND